MQQISLGVAINKFVWVIDLSTYSNTSKSVSLSSLKIYCSNKAFFVKTLSFISNYYPLLT